MDITNGEAKSSLNTLTAGTLYTKHTYDLFGDLRIFRANRSWTDRNYFRHPRYLASLCIFFPTGITSHQSCHCKSYLLLCPYLQNDVQKPSFSLADGNNSLATKYRQSHLCQNVLQELEHVSQCADGTKGPDEAADYATTFFYQVSKLTVDVSFRELISHLWIMLCSW